MSTNINVDMLISHLVNQGSAGSATQTVNADQLLALLVNQGGFNGNSANADQVIALIVEQRLAPPIIVNEVDQVIVLIVEQRRIQQWTFQDPAGNPIAFGTVWFDPSTDLGAGQAAVAAGITSIFTLDATGSVTTHMWPTDSVPGSHYTVQVFTALGEPCFYRQVQFTAAGAQTWIT